MYIHVGTSNDLAGDLNFFLSGHEDQDVTEGGLEVHLQHLSHSALHVVFTRVSREEQLHGKGATGDGEDWHVAKKRGEFVRVHRG